MSERLLSNKELRREIDHILYDEHPSRYSVGDSLTMLIDSQKQAWADYVIGEDERELFPDIEYKAVLQSYRNELRAEQRERNKL